MPINKERAKEVVEYLTLHGKSETVKHFDITEESLSRYTRFAKQYGVAEVDKSKLLSKIAQTYSDDELRAIANGGRIVPGLAKVPVVNFDGDRVRIGAITDTHIGSLNFSEQRLYQAFEEFKKEKVDFITHSGDVCVPANTLITTKNGFVPIENIREGDIVLSHTNRWNKVTKCFKREISEEIVSLHTDSSKSADLSLTGNHPVYVTTAHSNGAVGDNPSFIDADKVTTKHNHLLNILDDSLFKRIEHVKIGIKPKFDHVSNHDNNGELIASDTLFQAIGLFLGDGSVKLNNKRGIVSFYLENRGKKNLIGKQIVEKFCDENKFELKVNKRCNVNAYYINSKPLAKFFYAFYNDKKEKSIPLKWVNIPTDQLKHILYGLIISDGTILKNRYVRINNTSLSLLKLLKLRLESSGIYCTLNMTRPKGISSFGNMDYPSKDYYELSFNNASCTLILEMFNCAPRNYLAKNKYEKFNFVAKTILQKDKTMFSGYVYNIEVETDNSYIANGIIVHNCEGMSHRAGHVYDLSEIGYDKQKAKAIEIFSQWTDSQIYAIDGNHDRWFIKSNGALIVKDIATQLDNFNFIGHDEGDISINGKAVVKLWHGEDGNSYALSYRLQKILESLSGGEKPSVIICGHTHKYVKIFERNVYAISAGSIQSQTPWMRGKRIAAHVGFCIIDIYVNKSGVCKFSDTWYPFYT